MSDVVLRLRPKVYPVSLALDLMEKIGMDSRERRQECLVYTKMRTDSVYSMNSTELGNFLKYLRQKLQVSKMSTRDDEWTPDRKVDG